VAKHSQGDPPTRRMKCVKKGLSFSFLVRLDVKNMLNLFIL